MTSLGPGRSLNQDLTYNSTITSLGCIMNRRHNRTKKMLLLLLKVGVKGWVQQLLEINKYDTNAL